MYNTSKPNIEYSLARYYKTSFLFSTLCIRCTFCKGVEQCRIRCNIFSVIPVHEGQGRSSERVRGFLFGSRKVNTGLNPSFTILFIYLGCLWGHRKMAPKATRACLDMHPWVISAGDRMNLLWKKSTDLNSLCYEVTLPWCRFTRAIFSHSCIFSVCFFSSRPGFYFVIVLLIIVPLLLKSGLLGE